MCCGLNRVWALPSGKGLPGRLMELDIFRNGNWGMVKRSAFGMTFGLGILPSKHNFGMYMKSANNSIVQFLRCGMVLLRNLPSTDVWRGWVYGEMA